MSHQEKFQHNVCVHISGPGEYHILLEMAQCYKQQMNLRFINTSKAKLNMLGLSAMQFRFQKPQAFISCQTQEMKAFVLSRLELYRRNVETLEKCFKMTNPAESSETVYDNDESTSEPPIGNKEQTLNQYKDQNPPFYDNWP